ncbi:MAG TPA: hypothetical protein VHF89_09150 [Solirubrobacteraceae bacterium]|nr:hypothetical protein [Solirubrobacteraceae bacterium]
MRRLAPIAAALVLLPAASAAAHHPVEEEAPAGFSAPVHLLHLGSGSELLFARFGPPGEADATSPLGRGLGQAAPEGPCTDAAKRGMPEGEGHDHQDVTQHRNLRCRIEQVAFLSLKEELAARPDVVLGEMDVKHDVAAVAVVWPEGGLLIFDVSDPANPEFKSWYRSTQCEGAAIANNCGAFVDISADGKTAFIAQQSVSFVPGADPDSADPGPLPTTSPGVEVVDISDLESPRRTQVFPVLSQGGVHTARSHRIPGKGEYVFSIANRLASNNGSGIDIARFDPATQRLAPTSRIEIGETHDTFIQNDPVDGKTYLYIAGGFSKGLVVYDVSDPASPKHVANWNLTPECTDDWYSHTVDVAHRNGRRIVTMPAELFVSSNQTDAEKAMGCGNVAGNGDQPGPLWIIDATDFSKLGQTGDTNEELKTKSERNLIATWVNPARRAAGNLTFSPHNQQIVGDRIYLSDYHGGVFVLDAKAAFEGRKVRPDELGFIIPNGERSNDEARPAAGAQGPVGAVPRTRGRSSIWDMVYYRGFILAADQIGGFYSLSFAGDEARQESIRRGADGPAGAPGGSGPIGQPGTARRRRQLRLVRNRLRGGRLRIELRGTRVRDVRRVTFVLNGRRIAVDRRAPFRVTLRLRNARQRFRLVARVTLRGNQRVTLRRSLTSRAPRRAARRARG